LIDLAQVDNRELKILARDVQIASYLFGRIADGRKILKDETDEPLREIIEHKASEARDCASDPVRHAGAGSAVLWNPQTS
jgi:hypothetical protein